ncbi:MAG: hypothetical protein JNK30_06695 [Phenylobacterium sp.]|uniref:hypothetical protein n=1 Tax=Phenylobacterium sp. TaxID=1871053 RepID=UPI001A39552D|nr:hypothetical protein [Phenylobacterium sp.]MBL8771055.1 hypothetical protein [Phenylobacterium sp.]
MSDPRVLTFRCPPELAALLPPPVAAAQGLPDWIRTMPAQAFSALAGEPADTVKRCPPFLDAMTGGFLIPLWCDVRVEAGEFEWDVELPAGSVDFPRAPIAMHEPGNVAGTPLFDEDRAAIKFHNQWTIEAPEGYALLFTHPVNRFDLPFTTLTGLVDCDRYRDAWIHFPAVWRDPEFRGVLRKGTPVAQVFPVRREAWTARTEVMTADDGARAQALLAEVRREGGVYRRRFRA